MVAGDPGPVGQDAASHVNLASGKGQGYATSQGLVQKDFHVLETILMKSCATLNPAIPQVRRNSKAAYFSHAPCGAYVGAC